VPHDFRKDRKAHPVKHVFALPGSRDKHFPEVRIKASSATRHDEPSAGRLWKQEQDKEP
jgi:hypothetical protein